MLLAGKRLLVTGVLTEASLAFGVARYAQEEGAEVVLTSFGRGLRLTRRVAQRLDEPPPVLEFDASDPEGAEVLGRQVAECCDRLDGVVHAIAYAPESCLGDDLLQASWEDVGTAVQISAYSLKTLAEVLCERVGPAGGSIVGLDFDASYAWPKYGWMGVSKAALESTARYLARQLGPRQVRVNLVAAGPMRTLAASQIAAFDEIEEDWDRRAPLGWDIADSSAVARASVALLSDLFPATTGEIVHVDGGFHAVGD